MKKLVFASPYDLQNLKTITGRRGTSFYTAEALKQTFFVDYVKLRDEKKAFYKLKQLAYKKISNKNYLVEREPRILNGYARQVKKAILEKKADCLFSTSSLPIAYLDTNVPTYFWTDSTFAGMHEYYPRFSNLCKETIRKGHAAEQAALNRCRLAIYSSDWAARTAIEAYKVDPEKVRVIPFGANVKSSRTIEEVNEIIENRSRSVCKLLFIGTDWVRKGGRTACEVVKHLNLSNIRVELTLVGYQSSFDDEIPDYIRSIGFLDSLSEEGSQKLEELMKEAHFLILPSVADCSPAVIREAYTVGLPVIATNTGGISTLVEDGVNGKLLSIDSPVSSYHECITKFFSDFPTYKQLATSAFYTYQNHFNWKNSCEKVAQLILDSIA